MITKNDVINLITGEMQRHQDTNDKYIEFIRPTLEAHGVYDFWNSNVDRLIVECVRHSIERKMVSFNPETGSFLHLTNHSRLNNWNLLLEEIRNMREYEDIRHNRWGNRISPWYEKHITLAFNKFLKQYESAGFLITMTSCGKPEICFYSVYADLRAALNNGMR